MNVRRIRPPAQPAVNWRMHALCAQVGGDQWFPEPGDSKFVVAEARAVCARCPVTWSCLEDALAYEDGYRAGRHGVRAGTTPEDREKMARGKLPAVPHGVVASKARRVAA